MGRRLNLRFLPLVLLISIFALANAQTDWGHPDSADSSAASAVEDPTDEFMVEDRTSKAAAVADRELEAYVDGLVATWQTVHGAPGYTVAVVRPGRSVFTKGYGLADVEAGILVDPAATRFHVASISKTFIWTATMMLAERGVLDLDQDVNTYLQRYTVPDRKRALTLRDLLSHRAGLEDTVDLFSTDVAPLERAEAIALTEPRQVFPRGTRAAYSNWGSNLTALVIEDATGRDYADFLFEEILRPLGMNATTLTDESPAAQDPATPVAKNYRATTGAPEELGQLDLGSFAPIGGMTTTADDMARWMRFHLNRGELDGVRLLSEATYASLRTRDFDPVAGAPGRARGFADIPYRSIEWYGHTGSINAFLSKFAIAPALELGVFIAQNTGDRFAPLDSVPARVFDRELALRGEGAFAEELPQATEADVEAAKALAGRYITSRRSFSGPMKLFDAINGVAELDAEDGYLIGGQSNAPYARIAPDLWENRLGHRLAFVRDADGSVDRVITSGGATDAVPVNWRTDPMILGIALGATALFALTTWLGLWRRFRQQRESRRTGVLLSLLALLATLPLVWLAYLASRMPRPDEVDFAEVFSNWPLPMIAEMSLVATVTAAAGAVVAIGVVPVWTRSGWNLLRRVHYTLYAVSYAALALLLVHWGLVFDP